MNRKPALSDLNAFLNVATQLSFKKAADALGLAPSSLTHTIRTLEETMGVRLFHRTTRSVSLTEAGERLLRRLAPALRELDGALDEVAAFRGEPSGTVRINSSEIAAQLLLAAVVPTFLERYPSVALDLVTEGRLVDIVAEGFDAGVRLGESLPQDMIAVPFGGARRFVAVAAPALLAERAPLAAPDDLRGLPCIRIRMPSGKPYRWEFARDGEALSVEVDGPLTLDHPGLMVQAAAAGLGVAYVPWLLAAPLVEAGALRTVLDNWCPAIPGLFLYYPGRRHLPTGLRAFIDVLKETLP